MIINTEIQFLNQKLPTPFVLASGVWGTTVSLLERAAQLGCGAVTAKSCGPTPRAGHVNPSCVNWEHGLLNAIGLANPGVEEEVALLAKAKEKLTPLGVPLIASIFAGTPQEFEEVASMVANAKPDFLEVNISCPNVGSEFGEPFAGNPESAAEVTQVVKGAVADAKIPVIVKLAPNVPSVARIARAVVEAGADALSLINTMPGMLIDAESGQPILANYSGGLSGPMLKPIALKCVHDVHKVCPEIPIIGIGGVTTGQDAIEMLMAGATAVGIGSAIYHRGADAIQLILDELTTWLEAHHYEDVNQVRHMAHQNILYETAPSKAPIPTAH